MYARDATADAFGIDLIEASPERAVVTMQVRPDMCNGLDVIHGGMTFLLADSAMAFASNSTNERALASSAEIDWLAPATTGELLTATAQRRAAAGRTTLWDITVEASRGDDATLVAIVRGRTRTVRGQIVEGQPAQGSSNTNDSAAPD